MNHNERVPYLCDAGGKTERAVLDFMQDRTMADAMQWAFAEHHGANQVYRNDRLMGLGFAAPPGPDLWVKVPGVEDVYRPRYSRKGSLYADFKNLPVIPGLYDLAARIGVERTMDCDSGRIFYPVPEVFSGRVVLQLYHETAPPADCARMKMSDYWLMRESA